jgi:hypothetical protein
MLQFTLNRKLDPDGAKFRALLKAQITYEQLGGFRSLYVDLTAAAALPLWPQAFWPDLLPPEIQLIQLALWRGRFSLASGAAVMEYLARRKLAQRLAANNGESELTDPGRS